MRPQKKVLAIILVVIAIVVYVIIQKIYIDTNDKFTLFQEGDLIFQISKTAQSKAIQLAANSKYSHMGLIYIFDGEYLVFEAVQPVKYTPLEQWIDRGENAHYVVKRLKDAGEILSSDVIEGMKQTGEKYNNLDYDYFFEWTDDKIYCSELVWKIYNEVCGVEIGTLERLRDFDLSSEDVRNVLENRYGQNIPLDEKVISPARMFKSEKLITIFEN